MTHFERMQRLTRARRRAAGARGMTLIEIMVVVTILGLIAAAVGVAVMPVLACARQKRVLIDMSQIKQGLDLYKARTGKYPQSGEGLQALVSSKVFDKAPTDSWGNEYVYVFEGGKYTIKSYGADKSPGGDEDNADIDSGMVKVPCEEK